MTAKLYIASYDVTFEDMVNTGRDHSYLFYDLDGDLETTDDQRIIRGGPDDNYIGHLGDISGLDSENILVELRNLASDSYDYRLDTDTPTEQNFRLLSEGTLATNIFNAMKSYALTMGSAISGQNGLYETSINYDLLGPNSNSIINTLLNVVGLNFRELTPYADGSTTTFQDPSEYPGHMALIDGSGSESFTAFSYGNEATNFYKRNGNDTIFLENDTDAETRGRVFVNNSINSAGMTTIILEDVAYNDVTFTRFIMDIQSNNLYAYLKSELSNPTAIPLAEISNFYQDRTNDFAEGWNTTAFEFEDYYFRMGNGNANTINAANITKDVRIEAGGGTDTLYGGSGNDLLYGEAGNDTIYGGAGSDTFYGTMTATGLQGDQFHGGMQGGAWNRAAENDTVTYTGTSSRLNVTLNSSAYTGTAAKLASLNMGMPMNEGMMESFYNIDHYVLGGGNDFVTLNGDRISNIAIDAGAGTGDILNLSGSFDLSGTGALAAFTNFEEIHINGSAFRMKPTGQDYIISNPGTTNLLLDYGGATGSLFITNGTSSGYNWVSVSGGGLTDQITNQTMGGGTLYVGSNHGDTWDFNSVSGMGANTYYIWTGTGNDTVEIASGIMSRIFYTGGNDTIDSSGNFTLDLSNGIQENDVAVNIAGLTTVSEFYDPITTELQSATYAFNLVLNIDGYGSVDLGERQVMVSRDSISGNYNYFSFTSPTIYLEDGTKLVMDSTGALPTGFGFHFSASPDPSYAMSGLPRVGTEGSDTLTGTTVFGRGGDDILTAGGGLPPGGATLNGGGGEDKLNGGSGNDTLYGGDDNDFLFGKGGNDTLYGGAGSDTFIFDTMPGFSNMDTVYDFYTAENDKLDLSALFSSPGPVDAAIADYIRLTAGFSGGMSLSVDTNGGGNSFVQIATLYGIGNDNTAQSLRDNGHIIV